MAKRPQAKPRLTGKQKGGAIGIAIASIIASVVAVEGGFVDIADDPGGATNHGITERVARDHGFSGDMRDLTRDQAIEIYSESYAYSPGFDLVVKRSIALGQEVIDQGVNLGTRRPQCYLQTALNSLNRKGRDYPNLKVDCQIGPATMRAYDSLARLRGDVKACQMILKLIDAQQAVHYLRLASNDSRFETFMVGWVDHRIGNVPIDSCKDGGAE